jgi:hypothetical protein
MTDQTIASNDLNTIIDTISTAAHLGMNVPAPLYTKAYAAVISREEDGFDHTLGYFQNEEAAYIAIRNYILELHDESPNIAPWADAVVNEADADSWKTARQEWIATRTDIEIIESLLIDSGEYWVSHIRIQPNPARTV